MLVGGRYWAEGDKGEKKWDNCNSIINKIYLKTLYKQKTKKQKQTKETARTGTESQKWRLHGGLSVGR